jgi:hypothetical protein
MSGNGVYHPQAGLRVSGRCRVIRLAATAAIFSLRTVIVVITLAIVSMFRFAG